VIALIDYGAGNLTSVRKALTSLGAEFATPASPSECGRFSALIVPGVGNFAATSALVGPWREAIGSAVRSGAPLFGICLGMQWLFEGSDEAPEVPGLGVLPGRVARLEGNAEERLKIPHVGWNTLTAPSGPERSASQALRGPTGSAPQEKGFALLETGLQGRILAGLAPGAHVYFTHSYAAPVTVDCVAETRHADTFSAVVERGNVFGVQFHPEKSSDTGLQIIRNFLEVTRGC
jgi:imidazole glycerol-phosphate synthase subunit HisH